MKKLFAFALSALFSSQAATAQQLSPSLRDSLQKASDLMFEKGAYEFAAVDAVLDGILQPKEHYAFSYNDEKFRFEGHKMSKKQQQQYTEKFQACLKKQNLPNNTRISVHSDGIDQKEVFDTTNSAWAKSLQRPPAQSDSAKHLGDLLVLNMLQDKLVDTSEAISIVYTPGSITVNGTPLNADYTAKYIAIIEEVNKQSNSRPGMMSYSWSAHPHNLRYPHPGGDTKDK